MNRIKRLGVRLFHYCFKNAVFEITYFITVYIFFKFNKNKSNYSQSHTQNTIT